MKNESDKKAKMKKIIGHMQEDHGLWLDKVLPQPTLGQ